MENFIQRGIPAKGGSHDFSQGEYIEGDEFTGLKLLFLGLKPEDRSLALSRLASSQYAPRINALPDPFALIPNTDLTTQVDIMRSMLTRLSKNLGPDRAAISLSGDVGLLGDPIMGDTVITTEGDGHRFSAALAGDTGLQSSRPVTISMPIPEFAALSFIRNEMGGVIPKEIVGCLNFSPQVTQAGDYLEGDYRQLSTLEGGLFDSILSKAKAAVPMFSKLAGGLKGLTDSPLGKLAMKGLKLVPGVSNVLSAAELASSFLPGSDSSASKSPLRSMASSVTSGLADLALDTAKGMFANVQNLQPDVAKSPTSKILRSDAGLESRLDQTFGPEAVDNAILQVLAAEGDFYDDVLKGENAHIMPLSGDSTLDGDWKDQLQSMASSAYDTFKAAANKTAEAGSRAYKKLDPKVRASLSTPWGKAAAGGAGLAGSALLVYGVSKLMKDRPDKARTRLLQAKVRSDERKLATNVIAPNPSAGTSGFAGPLNVPGASGSTLPPLSAVSGALPIVAGGSLGTPGPMDSSVSGQYLKIPYVGVSLVDLAKEGAGIFKEYKDSLLSVNPGFLMGDVLHKDYTDYGSDFILHGFPMKLVTIIPASAQGAFERELKSGAPVTSPQLTIAILHALLGVTGGHPGEEDLLIRTAGGPSNLNWDRFRVSDTDKMLVSPSGIMIGDSDADFMMGDGDEPDDTSPSPVSSSEAQSDPSSSFPPAIEAETSPSELESLMPGPRYDVPVEIAEDVIPENPDLGITGLDAALTSPPSPEMQAELNQATGWNPGMSVAQTLASETITPEVKAQLIAKLPDSAKSSLRKLTAALKDSPARVGAKLGGLKSLAPILAAGLAFGPLGLIGMTLAGKKFRKKVVGKAESLIKGRLKGILKKRKRKNRKHRRSRG